MTITKEHQMIKCHCGKDKEENQIECFYCHNITVCTSIFIEELKI